nr:protein chromatin remodeling 25 [Tanacetum cinerariifolium]
MFIFPQVTFVFTNQINGKLVPVEPVDRLKKDEAEAETHTLKGNSYNNFVIPSKRQQTLPSSWSKSVPIRSRLPTSIRNSQLTPMEGTTHGASKPKVSLEKHLPQKRVSSAPVDDDDDFA